MSLQCPISVGKHPEDSPCGGGGAGGGDGTVAGIPIYEAFVPGGDVGGTTTPQGAPVATGLISYPQHDSALEIEGVS